MVLLSDEHYCICRPSSTETLANPNHGAYAVWPRCTGAGDRTSARSTRMLPARLVRISRAVYVLVLVLVENVCSSCWCLGVGWDGCTGGVWFLVVVVVPGGPSWSWKGVCAHVRRCAEDLRTARTRTAVLSRNPGTRGGNPGGVWCQVS